MGITIKDIAKLAGVTPSTVSRVIANNPKISEATREKVLDIMEEQGYHPNINARSLVVQNTETIGIIMPRSVESVFQNPFFPEVLRGISMGAQEMGYSVLMSTARNEAEEKTAIAKMVQGKQVDGVLLLHSRVDDPLISYLQSHRFPFVVIGRPVAGGIAFVDNDNVLAAYEATEYLRNRGHRRIAFLGGSLEYMVTRDRLQGYREALEKSGIPFMPQFVLRGDFLEAGGALAVKELLSWEVRPTALLVTDDLMAFGVISTLKEMGFSVPEDISIVSFNNVPLSKVCSPPLTSVDIDICSLGMTGVKLLFKQMMKKDTEPGHEIIDTRLIERQSVISIAENVD